MAKNSKSYKDGCVFINFGKFTRYSSVELHTANYTSGFFMTIGGKTFTNEIRGGDSIGIPYLCFTQGRLNEKGEVDTSDSRWFMTIKFLI